MAKSGNNKNIRVFCANCGKKMTVPKKGHYKGKRYLCFECIGD